MKPSDYPPSVANDEFVSEPTADEECRIDAGVIFVGAGPASLAGAIRLSQLLKESPDVAEALGETPVAVLEKGKAPGAHLLSGAVINPSGFKKLFPDVPDSDLPFAGPVEGEAVYYLTSGGSFRLPTPPTMKNHGNMVASLSQVGRWMAEKAEEQGVMVLPETNATHLLVQDGRVAGVRTGDKGRDRDGSELPNFEPGLDMLAQVTVLGEGAQGHLTQAGLTRFGVKRPGPQTYALGVKEVWEVPRPLDRVIHTMGWPLRAGARYREFGGSFAYPLGKDQVSLGLVVGMDYRDADLSVHDLFQEMKTHPLFKPILQGGRRLEMGWGAKTIPEGGYYSVPEKLYVPGAVFVGDSAGFVNVPSLKGVHYAMWSGIFAAETIFEALKNKAGPAEALAGYDRTVRDSFIMQDLYKVRNMRQAFHGGFWKGAILAGLMTLTGGRFPGGRIEVGADSEQSMFRSGRTYAKADGTFTFDKASSAYASGNKTRDNMPSHLRVKEDVPEVIGETWINMCPAGVYEWEEGDGGKRLRVNAPNCIHCGAITAKGGLFTAAEGGTGPEYTRM